MKPPGSLLSAIRSAIGDANHGDIDELLVTLFRYQIGTCVPWNRLSAHLGIDPHDVDDWKGIPPIPVAAYKSVWVGIEPPERCVPEAGGRTFLSSGTTGAESSRNGLPDWALEVYALSVWEGWNRFPAADGVARRVIALMPPPDVAISSSLSHMAGILVERCGGEFHSPEVDGDWIASTKARMANAKDPVAVFGTAFAWVHLFDHDPFWRIRLPEGSLVIETGGYKGRSREIPVATLYGWFRDRLGIPDSACWSEYGMSELASQYWSRGVDGPKLAPPWLRTKAIDPVTGEECTFGQPGLLCHVDLANVGGAMAIRTADLGILTETGGLRCLGRLPGAPLRGCSLATEHWGVDTEPEG